MTAGSGWPSTAVNAGSTSKACGCQRSSSETAGPLPLAIPGAGCGWYSSSGGQRPHHLDSATYPRPGCDPGLPRRPWTDHRTGVANRNRLPVSHRPGEVSPIGRLSRRLRLPCRRNPNRPSLTHRRDRVGLRKCPPDHFALPSRHRNRVNPPAGRRNRNRPHPARPHPHRPHSCPPNDFHRPSHHHSPPRRRRRSRNRPARNRNRPNRRRLG
jgi:hypothetical protein